MKPVCVVECDTLRQMARREIFAYVGSFVNMHIAFVLGAALQWKWDLIGRFYG